MGTATHPSPGYRCMRSSFSTQYKSTTVSSHCASVQQSAPTGGPLSERIFYYKNYLIKFPFYLTSNRSGVLLARERWQITENIFSLRRFRQLTIGIINSIWHY